MPDLTSSFSPDTTTQDISSVHQTSLRWSRFIFPLLALTLLFLAALVMAGGASGEENDTGEIKEWTILIYMAADNNLEEAAILDMNELEEIGSSEDYNIVVQLDRHRSYDTSNEDWEDTRRYYVTRDDDDQNISSIRVDTPENGGELGEKAMNDPDVLVEFAQWGVENYPAKHYLLDLWDHGLGTNGGTLNDGAYMPLTGMEEAFMNIQELGIRFDILTIDACLMGGIETYHLAADVADIVASSEKLVPFYGYPYDDILANLEDDPTMNASTLASHFVKEYVWYYKPHSNIISTTQSAVDTRALLNFTTEFDSWLVLLERYFPAFDREIMDARNHSEEYDHSERLYNYVDLGHFIELVDESIDTREFDLASARLMELFDLAVVEEAHHSNRNKFDGKDLADNAHGFTIYFPGQSKDSYYNDYSDIRFGRESGWKDFLDLYFLYKDEDYRHNNRACAIFDREDVVVGTDGQGFNNSFSFDYSLLLHNDKSEQPLQLSYLLVDGDGELVHEGATGFFDHQNYSANPVNYILPQGIFGQFFLHIYLRDQEGSFLDYHFVKLELEFLNLSLVSDVVEEHLDPGESLLYPMVLTNTGNSEQDFSVAPEHLPTKWVLQLDQEHLTLAPGQSATIIANLTPPNTLQPSKVPTTIIIRASCDSNQSVSGEHGITIYVGGEDSEDDDLQISSFQLMMGGILLLIVMVVVFLGRGRGSREKEAGSGIATLKQEGLGMGEEVLPRRIDELPVPESIGPEPPVSTPTPSSGSGGFNLGGENIQVAQPLEPASGGFNLGGENIQGPQSPEPASGGFNLGGENISGPQSPEPASGGFNLGGENISGPQSPEPASGGFNLGGENISGPQSPEPASGGFNLGGEKIKGPEKKD